MKILLMCGAGMSTSLLVTKMLKYAKEKGYDDIIINAVAVEDLEKYLDEYDVFLLGPQIRYKEKWVQSLVENKGKKCITIPPQIYGMVDGRKTLELALQLLK